MDRTRTHLRGTALVVVTLGALVAGCSSGGGHQASPATSHRPTAPSETSQPKTAPSTNVGNASTAANRADLAALTAQLDAAGSSLGAAGSALAQTDPNQTKNSEGSLP
ncbi:MAG: hypothetical protein ACLPVY_00720 [Acidimicrobiia bacterium]